eukprot:7112447-Alexandrium_andersonii.AAC.1
MLATSAGCARRNCSTVAVPKALCTLGSADIAPVRNAAGARSWTPPDTKPPGPIGNWNCSRMAGVSWPPPQATAT